VIINEQSFAENTRSTARIHHGVEHELNSTMTTNADWANNRWKHIIAEENR